MTDLEERCLRLEAALGQTRAQLAITEKRIADLKRMNKDAQKYIGALQAQIKRNTRSQAERVFK